MIELNSSNSPSFNNDFEDTICSLSPTIAVSGVRISWETEARSLSFDSLISRSASASSWRRQ